MTEIPGCEFGCDHLDTEAVKLGAEWGPTIASYVIEQVPDEEKIRAFLVGFCAGFGGAALRVHDMRQAQADATINHFWDGLHADILKASPTPAYVDHDPAGKLKSARKRGFQ